jgi:ATP-dependent Clp protease protease subunit
MEQVMEKQIDIMDYKKEQAFYMKEIEWGVNSDTNTTWMNHEFEIDSVYSVQIKLDYLLRSNPSRDINMNITSYGGDVYAMLGLVDFIRSLPVKVNTHCIGTCMSAASVLLACGTGVRSMSKNSTVMVHEGSAFEAGKTTDVMKGVDHLKDLQKNINLILGEVSNKDASFWKKIQRNDTYLTAQMCLEYGIIDKIA